jgi:DNA-binding response OmpR family regulator
LLISLFESGNASRQPQLGVEVIPATKLRVLIADDDSGRGRFLTSHLVARGFDVSSASSGEEALRTLRLQNPTLVLLDLTTPVDAAFHTLQQIKQAKPHVAVIILSARHDADTIFNASKLGADDYLAKPFEVKDLDLRIDRFWRNNAFPPRPPRCAIRSGATAISPVFSAPVPRWKK